MPEHGHLMHVLSAGLCQFRSYLMMRLIDMTLILQVEGLSHSTEFQISKAVPHKGEPG